MSNNLLLNPAPGHQDDDLVNELRREVNALRRRVTELQGEIETERRKCSRAIARLRTVLNPLYNSLRELYGEMEGVDEDDVAIPVNNPTYAVWESWKQKLGGKPADLISALLVHNEMSAVQLRVAMKCHINSVYETTAKLQKMGLLNKNGGKYSLKQL